ncbi:hypothetical protein [Lentzea sp. NPDC060358]|uniref:MutS-related protein n=1 Tax=Lentzea sp. NPDC060358 TaxID=3347103 RepID=UPI0036552425
MKPGLLFAAAVETPERIGDGPARRLAEHAAEDLGLAGVIDAMACGDPVLAEAAREVLLAVPPPRAHVAHRQAVLVDFLAEPELARQLYELAGRALTAQRDAARRVLFDSPETLLTQSVATLTEFVHLLRELRSMAEEHRPRVSSAGLVEFFDLVEKNFDEPYLRSATAQLGRLALKGELLFSARLGTGNHSDEFVLRQPLPPARGLFRRDARKIPTATYKIPPGDEGGHRALSSLRDQALAGVAGAAVRSAQDVLAFFTSLHREAAFYVGCVTLRRALAERGAPICVPVVREAAPPAFTASGLYDPGLQLRLDHPAVANDVDADRMALVVVTGANRGGKSTFLRSAGLAQLMANAGMFVAATEFTTSARSGVLTHFTRDEDRTLTSGKFDEELRRMSDIADVITPNAMLLCNEPFQSTNEREGSDIARHVIDALTDAGVTVFIVTHLHELAHGCHEDRESFPALFLRAERDDDGQRSYRLHEGEPRATSHGADLWNRARKH